MVNGITHSPFPFCTKPDLPFAHPFLSNQLKQPPKHGAPTGLGHAVWPDWCCSPICYFLGWPELYMYTPYMNVYLVVSLPRIPHIHRIYMVLANPSYFWGLKAWHWSAYTRSYCSFCRVDEGAESLLLPVARSTRRLLWLQVNAARFTGLASMYMHTYTRSSCTYNIQSPLYFYEVLSGTNTASTRRSWRQTHTLAAGRSSHVKRTSSSPGWHVTK